MKSESTWRLVARPLAFVHLTNFRFVGRAGVCVSTSLLSPCALTAIAPHSANLDHG